MEGLKPLAAQVAIKNMVKKGWVDICTIKTACGLLGTPQRGEDIDVLTALHCIEFADMPPELLKALPELLRRVLTAEGFEMDYNFWKPGTRVLDA